MTENTIITPQLSENALLTSRFINHTGRNIFLTGKAGTGKTTFLRHIVQHTHKKTIIAAPTGIAAINAGGVTLHSLFQLPFGTFIPGRLTGLSQKENVKVNDSASLIKNLQMHENKRKLLRELELLIIDEVSMLRADLLDAIDVVLKYVRRKNYLPFGGVQVLFIGDLLQLPPVVKNEEWSLLKDYYKSSYFFDSNVLRNSPPVYVELDKIYRQSDEAFISLLNNLRNNTVSHEDTVLLNEHYRPGFSAPPSENYITLTTHNAKALDLNKKMLQELEGRSYYYHAQIEDEFSKHIYPVEKTLELKKGAQVMFIKNDPTGGQRFFNGKIGVVSDLSKDEVTVRFGNGETLEVEKYQWENVKFILNETTNEIEERVAGTFTQYPLKLAWAITVHKSQGLTFDKAVVDISGAFAPGQVYVALSRLRSLRGLVLSSPVNFGSLMEDKKVSDFSKTKTEQEDPTELLKKETILFLRSYVSANFDLSFLVSQFDEHVFSYTKDEKRSARQKQHKWAADQREKIIALKQPADKFIHHLSEILDKEAPGFVGMAHKRLQDAEAYFAPVLKEASQAIFKKIEALKTEKKIKGYVSELLQLEVLLFEQLRRLRKAIVICASILENTALDKNHPALGEEQFAYVKERQEILARVLQSGDTKTPVTVKKEKKKHEPKPKSEKKVKGDTQKETLKLFQEGKSIAEIAGLRGVTMGTIEGHLASLIAKGILDATELVDADKIKAIISVAKELDTFNLGPIKNSLGDEFSFGEIRMALAAHLAK